VTSTMSNRWTGSAATATVAAGAGREEGMSSGGVERMEGQSRARRGRKGEELPTVMKQTHHLTKRCVNDRAHI
jgi:hypothetical protein